MRISAKSRYALAAIVFIAMQEGSESVPVITISEKLGISKIYLEQVFSLLKNANLVLSTKGAQGGYRLAKPADKTTVEDVLRAVEQSLFEPAGQSVASDAGYIGDTIQSLIWEPLDRSIRKSLSETTLQTLAVEAGKQKGDGSNMFYI